MKDDFGVTEKQAESAMIVGACIIAAAFIIGLALLARVE